MLRNPGGRVTAAALTALALGVHLLNVRRVLIVPHTRCAMTSSDEAELHRRLTESSGIDSSWLHLGTIPD